MLDWAEVSFECLLEHYSIRRAEEMDVVRKASRRVMHWSLSYAIALDSSPVLSPKSLYQLEGLIVAEICMRVGRWPAAYSSIGLSSHSYR